MTAARRGCTLSERRYRVHVLLVDDDPSLSEMLVKYLAGEGIRTSVAYNGADGVTAALSQQFDAMILDVMLPGMDGNEVLRRVRRESAIPIIMLTAKGGDLDRVIGLEMGADDYLAKPYYPPELVARLRAVLRRQRDVIPLAITPLNFAELSLSPGKREVSWNGRRFELTTKEFNILECLLRAGEMVSTKEDLSLKILGRMHESYDRSLDVHVSNLKKKMSLAAKGLLEIERIRGVGFRLRRST